MERFERIDEQARAAFGQDSKVGLLATLNERGLPHVSLITTLQSRTPTSLIWGQFCEGLSKDHVRRNPKTGFLIMSLDRSFWRGRAMWTHARQDGDEYELFNHKPLFRYNAYFGVHTAHYMDLVDVSERGRLALAAIAAGTAAAAPAALWASRHSAAAVLGPFSRSFLARPDTLKFLAYVDRDGHPTLVPVVPGLVAGQGRMVIVGSVFRRELAAIPAGSPVALFGLNLKMESLLVRGAWRPLWQSGLLRRGGLSPYCLDLDFAYNSMPPLPGQVYPAKPLEAVSRFA